MINEFSADHDADTLRATNFANRALQLAPNDVEVLRNKAVVLRARGDLDEAAALLRKVIELAPQWGWQRRELSARSCCRQGITRRLWRPSLSAKRLISVTGADSVAPMDWSLAMGLLVNDRFPEAIAQTRLRSARSPPRPA